MFLPFKSGRTLHGHAIALGTGWLPLLCSPGYVTTEGPFLSPDCFCISALGRVSFSSRRDDVSGATWLLLRNIKSKVRVFAPCLKNSVSSKSPGRAIYHSRELVTVTAKGKSHARSHCCSIAVTREPYERPCRPITPRAFPGRSCEFRSPVRTP